MLDDIFDRLHLFDRYRIPLEPEKVPEEDRPFFVVYPGGEFLELIIAPQAGRELQGTDSLRIPGMRLSIFTIRELADIGQ